jgi:hypothetical protein
MQASCWINKRARMCALRMWSEVRTQMYSDYKLLVILSLSNTYTKTSSTQHTTKIVINETCRLIALDVEDHYVNTLINVVLHIVELLLTFLITETSVHQISLLLLILLKQYYFQFSDIFQNYERCFHGIHYFLSSRRDIYKTVGTFNSEIYDRN